MSEAVEGREGARAAAARIARGWTEGASEKRAADGQGDAVGEEARERQRMCVDDAIKLYL